MSARHVLRDALLEQQGSAPEAESYDLLAEALDARDSEEPTTAALAAEVVEEASGLDLLRASFPGFRPRK